MSTTIQLADPETLRQEAALTLSYALGAVTIGPVRQDAYGTLCFDVSVSNRQTDATHLARLTIGSVLPGRLVRIVDACVVVLDSSGWIAVGETIDATGIRINVEPLQLLQGKEVALDVRYEDLTTDEKLRLGIRRGENYRLNVFLKSL